MAGPRGWYWGSEAFRQKLLDLAAERLGGLGNRNQRSSRQWHDHAQVGAINLIREGLRELGLSEDELKASRGSERRKVSVAWAVARSTTVSQSWIARRLNMRSGANVSQQIRRFEKDLKRQTDSRIRSWIKTVKNC
jgi:putative transposase